MLSGCFGYDGMDLEGQRIGRKMGFIWSLGGSRIFIWLCFCYDVCFRT